MKFFLSLTILIKSINHITQVSQKRHHFGFGSAVNHSPLKNHKKYKEFFMKHFDWGVPESAMKWNIMEEKKVKEFKLFLMKDQRRFPFFFK